MKSELAKANTLTNQQRAIANREAGILEGNLATPLTEGEAMYNEKDELINPARYAKGGVIGAARMMYAKGGTIVGKGGPKEDAIFTKANKEGIEPGSFIVPAENNEKAKGIRAALFGDKNKVSKFKKGGEMESDVAVSNGEHLFTPKERKKIVNYLGEEILEELAPNAEENSEEMSQGGLLGTLTDRENMREYKGGGLTKSKAKTMLHEGMANGKPITEQQRKYFGWVAGGSKQSKMDGGDIHGYAMGTDVEGVDGGPQSNKTYAELITPPLSWKGSKEAYKAAADKAIKEGKVVPKGGVTTTTTTKSVAAPSVKGGKKGAKVPESVRFVPKMVDESEGEGVIVPGVAKQETDFTSIIPTLEDIEAEKKQKIKASLARIPDSTTPTSPAAPRKGLADYVKNIDPGAAFSAYQIGQGSKLLKSGQRPTDVSKIDPAWNAAVERAQREATFGYTPEQAAMLDQKAINALNDARFSGRNLAGGSAGTAFQQERQAINQGWTNALQLKSADQQLRMQKQQYADQAVRERAAFLDSQRRRAFGDAMDTYNVNQESGSALVGAGVRNAIGAFRYQKELDAQESAKKKIMEAQSGQTVKNGNITVKKMSASETEAALNKLYNSPEYQNLSTANKQLLKSTISLYNPADLKDLTLSNKEVQLIHAQTLQKAAESYGISLDSFKLDNEQTLAQDLDKIQGLIDAEAQRPASEQRNQSIRTLTDALNDARSQYEIAAKNKNEWLQTQLADVQYELNTSIGRADEDKLIKLKSLERTYNTNLRAVQDSMSQRGLAFSGIRARAENDEAASYEDSRTTAQIEADRLKADAQRLAMEKTRDYTTLTEQEKADLLNTYNINTRNATQAAEAVIGTDAVKDIVGQQPAVAGGIDVNANVIGDTEGTYARAARDAGQTQAASQNALEDTLTTAKIYGKI